MNSFVLASLAGVMLILPMQIQCQSARVARITVAIDVADSSSGVTTGLGSALRAALRSLGDVDVVTGDEPHDYQIRGAVLPNFDRDPQRWHSLSASLIFVEPYSASVLRTQLDQLSRGKAIAPVDLKHDAEIERVAAAWGYYAAILRSMVVVWGRDKVERGAREWVRELDESCFEAVRKRRRALALMSAGDHERARLLMDDLIGSRRYVC